MQRMREVTFLATRARQLTPDNVHEAVHLLPDRLIGPECVHFDAVAACRRLLASGSMMGALVDALDAGARTNGNRSNGTRVVGVGAGVFVSSGFVRSEREHPRPGLTERVLWSALGADSVALDRREIAAENMKGGLSLVIPLHHWDEQESEEVKKEYRRHIMMGFLQDVRGYRLREILAESFGEAELSYIRMGGYRLRSDFADWYESHVGPVPQRFQAGITRDEALADEGSVVSLVFQYEPARFGFTQSQRKLLIHGIDHKTDAEIAAALGVSRSAVKKTWAAIFDKTSHQFRDVESPGEGEDSRPERQTRGAQKRHTLLTYLLDHPEELRP